MIVCLSKRSHNRLSPGAYPGGWSPLENVSPPPLEKCVGHNLKILDVVQKSWASLEKLFAPPGVPSWLRAWLSLRLCSKIKKYLPPQLKTTQGRIQLVRLLFQP